MLLLTTQQPLLLPQWCEGLEDETSPEDVLMHRRLPDGRLICLMPRLRGVSLAIGMPYPFHRIGVFSESWDYTNIAMGYYAFHSWNPAQEKEPSGWTRHPSSGRYRIGGDPGMQYVQRPGTLQEQIIEAVFHSMMQEEHLVYTEEVSIKGATVFPLGTQCFISYTQMERCPHVPKCEYPYTTFHYQGRSVVLSMDEMFRLDPVRVITCLTSEEGEYPCR